MLLLWSVIHSTNIYGAPSVCQPEGHQREGNWRGLLVLCCLQLHRCPWCRPLCLRTRRAAWRETGWGLARAAWGCCPGWSHRSWGVAEFVSVTSSWASGPQILLMQDGGDGISSLGWLWASNTNTRKAAGFLELFLGAGLWVPLLVNPDAGLLTRQHGKLSNLPQIYGY